MQTVRLGGICISSFPAFSLVCLSLLLNFEPWNFLLMLLCPWKVTPRNQYQFSSIAEAISIKLRWSATRIIICLRKSPQLQIKNKKVRVVKMSRLSFQELQILSLYFKAGFSEVWHEFFGSRLCGLRHFLRHSFFVFGAPHGEQERNKFRSKI